jgi:BlaI family transcriptional regulator, penicillinase repressor
MKLAHKPKSEEPHNKLSRRERQIMDIIYKRERATAADVQQDLPDQPNYSTVRAQLRVLEEKGYVRHEERGLRYVFLPTIPREQARTSALRRLMETFFDGSAEGVVAALLDGSAGKLSEGELNRLSGLIEKAKKEGL